MCRRHRQGLCKPEGAGVEVHWPCEKGKTSLKGRNLASWWCLLQGQVTQNGKLLQEHFIRAYPAQRGKKNYLPSMINTSMLIYPRLFELEPSSNAPEVLVTPVYSQPLKRSNKSFIVVYNELIYTLSPREQRGTLTQTHTRWLSVSSHLLIKWRQSVDRWFWWTFG